MLVRQLTKQLSRSLNTALSGIADAITKVLIDLSPTSNGFYSLGTDSVLNTAYKLGISAVLPTASTTYALFGKASDANNYLKILSSGYLSLDVDGTVVTSTVLATKDSEYREYSVTLSGNDFIFKENTTTISTVTNATAAAKTLTLNLIGKSNAGEFYLGILADPIMGSLEFELDQITANTETVDGVTVTYQNIGTGTDVRDTYTLIDDDYFGVEQVINGDFATDSDWTLSAGVTISGNKLNITTPSSQSSAIQSGVFVAGSTYETTFRVSGYVSGRLLIYQGSQFLEQSNDDGKFTVAFTADSSGDYLSLRAFSNQPFEGSVESVSVKRKIEVA